jgi:hypothetical protein
MNPVHRSDTRRQPGNSIVAQGLPVARCDTATRSEAQLLATNTTSRKLSAVLFKKAHAFKMVSCT